MTESIIALILILTVGYPAAIFGSLIFDLVALVLTFAKARKAWQATKGSRFHRGWRILQAGMIKDLPDISYVLIST